ncbi:glycosyl hydrolase family 28 protein [uncultured Draconibacterium sp.]|uniref:glycoside hydrolase family 28 protein n=1 Tax=uncultured Draconibacterium sp. TaxID=1573823 RepID=UPI0029C7A759|nr:glycosyl hydrolase family 28 protein [uncultured Draconibacterium sp.]
MKRLTKNFILTLIIACLLGSVSAKDKNAINRSIVERNSNFDNFYLSLEKNLEQMAEDLDQHLAKKKKDLPIFNVVTDFKADNSGFALTTKHIQHAVDSCTSIGGARLFFPKGMYLLGTVILKSNVHFEFADEAKIIASTNPDDYIEISPDYKNNTDRQVNKSLFYAEHAHDISFRGKGIIDFQGDHPQYLYTGNNDPRRPFGIRIVSSKNIYMNGLFLQNSPQWMQHYLDCENVMIENVNVFNHAHQNNDGMDIDGCRNVYVRNCRVDSDDDAICLKSNGLSPCKNVLIEDCKASSHCNALKLGTETTGGFYNIIYRNCEVLSSVTGTHHVNGVASTRTAITLIITDGGRMENVWFDNIKATGCLTPIYVTLGNRSRKHTDNVAKPGIGSIENVSISNFHATGAGPITSSVTGLDSEHKIKNFSLDNIYIELSEPGKMEQLEEDNFEQLFAKKKASYPSSHVWEYLPTAGFYFRYIDGLNLNNIEIQNNCNDPRKIMITDGCENIRK